MKNARGFVHLLQCTCIIQLEVHTTSLFGSWSKTTDSAALELLCSTLFPDLKELMDYMHIQPYVVHVLLCVDHSLGSIPSGGFWLAAYLP